MKFIEIAAHIFTKSKKELHNSDLKIVQKLMQQN